MSVDTASQNYESINVDFDLTQDSVNTESIEESDSNSEEGIQFLDLGECEIIDELDLGELEQTPHAMDKRRTNIRRVYVGRRDRISGHRQM